MDGQKLELLVERIAGMDRSDLVTLLKGMDCDFRLDFTDEFLDSMSLERLRHVALAASLHAHDVRVPTCA